MCICIVKPENATLSEEAAYNSFKANPHGAGLCYLYRGVIAIKKGYFSFERLWAEFNAIKKINKGPMLVHFRISTSGNINKKNCHTWRIDKQHALIHNGILSSFS